MGVIFVDTAREYQGSEHVIGRMMRAGELAVT